jgi:hypothetical protein
MDEAHADQVSADEAGIAPAQARPTISVEDERALAQADFEASVGVTAWARDRERTIRSMQVNVAGIESVDCRGAMCRVTTHHADSQQAEKFVDEVETSPFLTNSALKRFPTSHDRTEFVYFITPNVETAPGPDAPPG